MLDSIIEKYLNEIVKNTCELIKIPSVLNENDTFLYPFGKEINSALEYVLDLGKKLGFRVKNLDNFCGYIEFGEGPELFGIIGHLDVVPAVPDEWSFPPFSGTISNDVIYGRGAVDDKGPVIASLYAMKAVMDYLESFNDLKNIRLKRRIRLILGLDEENMWRSINYYLDNEEIPTLGFTPDGNFPCTFSEKTVLSLQLSSSYNNSNDIIQILEIDDHSNAINVVPKICTTTLRLSKEISYKDFTNILKDILSTYNFEIDIYMLDNYTFKLTSHGKMSHSAHPESGINAISQLIIILYNIFDSYSISIPLLDFFTKNINIDFNGKLLNISYSDFSGKLTLNVSNFKYVNNTFNINLNLRLPSSMETNIVLNQINNKVKPYENIEFNILDLKPSIHVPTDTFLIKTLCDIYNTKTNSNHSPIAISGATYARAFNNCVSFGPCFPNTLDLCHKTNECIDIDDLILCSKIYAHSIYELNKH